VLEGANASEDIARIEEMRMVDCFIVFLLKNFACYVVKIYLGIIYVLKERYMLLQILVWSWYGS
jgi:hypothetical protein